MARVEWRPAKGYSGYEVSSDGRIRNSKGQELSPFEIQGTGYLKVTLLKDGTKKRRQVPMHRLVAEAFVENPDPRRKTQVNHINEDKHDNRASNLEWVTPSENTRHGTCIDRRAAKISCRVVMVYRGLSVVFDSAADAERRTGIPARSIQKCCVGRMNTTHGAAFAYLGADVCQ